MFKTYIIPRFPEGGTDVFEKFELNLWEFTVSYFEIFESLGGKILQGTQICVPCKILQGVRP